MQPSPLFVIAALACALQSCSSTPLHPVTPPRNPSVSRASVVDAPVVDATDTRVDARPVQNPPRSREFRPWEVTVGGAGTSNDNVDAGSAQATGSVGYYLSEVVELSLRQSGSYSDAGEGLSGIWNGATRVALDLHLPVGIVIPFVGGNFGYAYGDNINDSMMAGPEAGAKIYVKADAFVLLAVEYEYFFDKNDDLNSAFDDGQLFYGLSLGLRF